MAEGVVLNLGAILAVADLPEIKAEELLIGERIAAVARGTGPRGEKQHPHGADTIHAGLMPNGEVHVSWDQLHAYMRFPELGSQGPHGQPAQHFLRNAADHYAR